MVQNAEGRAGSRLLGALNGFGSWAPLIRLCCCDVMNWCVVNINLDETGFYSFSNMT